MPSAQGSKQKILEAAEKVFLEKGFAGARMQEIATEANINKGLLHYYFKTKENLFKATFFDSLKVLFPDFLNILNGDKPFVIKIREFIDSYFELLKDNPQLPAFLLSELNQNPDRILQSLNLDPIDLEKFELDVNTKIANGALKAINPKDLVLNIISICMFPFIAQPMLKNTLALDQEAYEKLLAKRKNSVVDFVIAAVMR